MIQTRFFQLYGVLLCLMETVVTIYLNNSHKIMAMCGFERETAEEYVASHAVNMGADTYKVTFAECFEDLGEIKL